MTGTRGATYLFGSLLAGLLVLCALAASVGHAQAAGQAAPESPFVVTRSGDTYTAASASGTTFTGTLKEVVESAAGVLNTGGGGVVHFDAGLFELGDSHFELKDLTNVTFEGAGIDTTTITNLRTLAADTEVFDTSRLEGGGFRDMTVNAGGPARSTSDAMDFDSGNNLVIERVKVTGARGRGIVFDGKDITGGVTRSSEGNVLRDCVITGVPADGIELLAASNNRIERCTLTNNAGHGIQATKSSTTADQPNKKPTANVIVDNTIATSGLDGVNITSGDANQITDNTILNSSQATTGRDGIKIASADTATCDDNIVSGNTATDNQATKTQRYGLAISSVSCNRTSVAGNDFTGNRVGEILDQGTGTIIGAPAPDVTVPSAPTGLAANATYKTIVELAWTAATDNVGVTGYQIFRNDQLLATTTGAATTYVDGSAAAGTTYSYRVHALDAAMNVSDPSNTATATTPTSGPLFQDGFESGDLARWTQAAGLSVQQAHVSGGTYAALGAVNGASGAAANKQLAIPESNLYFITRFKVISQGAATNVNLLRFRSNLSNSAAVATVFVTSTDRIGLRNDVTAVSTTSTAAAARGTWHTLQAHVTVSGTSSQTDVWLDGAAVPELTQSNVDLGTNPIGRVELGDPATTKTYEIAYDDVEVDRELIGGTPPPPPPPPAGCAYSEAVLADSPLAYWRFEETAGASAADSSGNNRHASYGGPTLGAAGAFTGSRAPDFDGINDYVQADAGAVLSPTRITVEAWVKSKTATWDDFGYIASKRSSYIIHPRADSKTIEFLAWIAGALRTVRWTPPADFQITDWHHYAGTYDGLVLALHVDGVQRATQVITGSLAPDNGPLFIGRDDGYPRHGNALIDEVAIYANALTSTRLTAHVNAASSGCGAP